MATQESTLRVGVDSKPMVDGAKRGEKALGELGAKSTKLGKTFDALNSKTGLLAKAFAALIAVGIGAFFTTAIRAAGSFETKLAEISTLVDTATFKMDTLTSALKEQSAEFGSTAIQQGAAAYQIISAGAGTATDAINLLTASNKLAVGGVTDVATAADGLTSLLNAYGLASSNATEVSDALFAGMRAGKTTIGELSSSLGKVAPLAAQAGVGVDELVAAVAALTKGGISTRESVTGVRAIMAAVVKPTSEAAEVAEKLGIQFDSAGLKSKGLAGFMEDLVAKTGGSTDAMAKLFGGVEALIPALALAGQAGVDMSAIMEDMATKSGATQAAFEKMTNTFEFQSAVLRGNLANVFLTIGAIINSVLTPALKFLNENFEAITRFVAVAAAGFTALLIPAMISMVPVVASATTGLLAMAAAWLLTPFGQIAALIVAASAALSYFGETTIKVGGITTTVWKTFVAGVQVAWDLLKEGAAVISDLFGGATDAASGFFSNVLGWLGDFLSDWGITLGSVTGLIKDAINAWIGLYVGLVKSVGAIVTTGIPAAFRLALGVVRNIVLDSVQWIVSTFAKAVGGVGDALAYLPGVADDLGASIRSALRVDFTDVRADTAALKEEFNGAGAAISEAFGSAQVDYVGAFGDAVSSVSDVLEGRLVEKLRDTNTVLETAAETSTEVADVTTNSVVPAIDALAESAGGAASAMSDLNKERQAFIDSINEEFSAIQESQGGAVASVEMWYHQQRMALQQLGLEYTEFADKLDVIFNQRVAAAYKKDLANANDWRSGLERAVQGLGESIGNEADLAEEALTSLFNNATNAIVDFVKTGKFDFKEFARSVAADILMLTTKMLLLGAVKKLMGFSEGGLVPGFSEGGLVPGFASGGLVRGPGTSTSDSIMARLSAGEFVVNAAATKENLGFLQSINEGGSLAPPERSGGVARSEATSKTGSTAPTIINLFDPALLGQYISTPEGRRAIVNIMQEEGIR